MEVIRRLTLDDLDQMLILRIGIQNYDLKFMDQSKIKINEEQLLINTKEYIKNNLNKTIYMFGLFIDDELVSNCGFYLDRQFPTYKNPTGLLAYICNVYTKDEYRARGYQKKVFQECINYAKKMNITRFELDSINDIAIHMYESFNFKRKDSFFVRED